VEIQKASVPGREGLSGVNRARVKCGHPSKSARTARGRQVALFLF
jgi:hypothetical protein